MAWGFLTGWINGQVPAASDFNAIGADLRTRGGPVDGGNYGRANTSFLTLIAGDLPGTSYTVTAGSWASGVATLTIGAHNIKVNQHVSVSSVTPTGYNTTDVAISAVTGTTISFALLSNPGAWSSGGTVIVDATGAAAGMLAIGPQGYLLRYNGTTWTSPISAPPVAVTLVNGANQNVAIPGFGVAFIITVGPTGGFSIGGIAGGVAGQVLNIINSTGQQLTLNHQDAGSVSANRINVPAGANAVLRSGNSTATLIYAGSFWWVMATN
jgi:hypothetical protein